MRRGSGSRVGIASPGLQFAGGVRNLTPQHPLRVSTTTHICAIPSVPKDQLQISIAPNALSFSL